MRRPPHLLRVDPPAETFASLFAAAAVAGLRLGWLALEPPPTVPGPLEEAAALGALRAVAVGGGRSLALKPMRGSPVLGDLLREHFRGCAAVLVAGTLDPGLDAPWLRPAGDRWRIDGDVSASVALSSDRLVGRLRHPRPWADLAGAPSGTAAPPTSTLASGR